MGKRLSLKEINIAKHEEEVFNSRVKRGEVDTGKYVKTHYVVCECGQEGCGFITRWMKSQDNVVDLAEEKEDYQKWLKDHQARLIY